MNIRRLFKKTLGLLLRWQLVYHRMLLDPFSYFLFLTLVFTGFMFHFFRHTMTEAGIIQFLKQGYMECNNLLFFQLLRLAGKVLSLQCLWEMIFLLVHKHNFPMDKYRRGIPACRWEERPLSQVHFLAIQWDLLFLHILLQELSLDLHQILLQGMGHQATLRLAE